MTSPLPCPDANTCWLYLVRHGATANNLATPPILQGRRVNAELSEQGRREAEATSRFLANFEFAAMYCSPLVRALQTAEIIAKPHGLTPTIVEDIIEADVGHWETRSWVEIAKTEPEAYQKFQDDSGAHGYAGGENLTQVVDRVDPAMRLLMEDNLGGRVMVAAHNVVNRSWMCRLLGMPVSNARHIPQDNCAVNIIRYRQGAFKLVTINAVFHLVDM